MSDYKDRLADYIEVPDRIRQFIEKYPDGCLRRLGEPEFKTLGEQTFIVYTALALRSPTDRHPGMGTAWEPFPGKTTYTKDSELMNAETSAWGRALAALGFVGKKIATKEEVKARQNGETPSLPAERIAQLKTARDAADVDARTLRMLLVDVGLRDTGPADKPIPARVMKSLSPEQADQLEQRLSAIADQRAAAA